MYCGTFPSIFLHLPGVPLVGVELYGSLTDRDEVEVPAAQDRESYGHTKTDKPLKTE